ncbi:hypothetical protein FEM48_Zijuj04G0196500 [Ziziphus jujuba var. spinosa]|uniref:Uncharacterized protein n=1 Tax=Ziziphus jujuba var. spinosa TaxID=714518 RepID=A0A978VLT2_ZIZJJ|nr:hypothetical protein FEM48_Zijuj04G0196500 [Ziziphus jujuba var. spinosa]
MITGVQPHQPTDQGERGNSPRTQIFFVCPLQSLSSQARKQKLKVGVVLKKLQIRRVLSKKIENLHRKNSRSWRKQLKPIKQRSFTRKRKCTSSRYGDLLLVLDRSST